MVEKRKKRLEKPLKREIARRATCEGRPEMFTSKKKRSEKKPKETEQKLGRKKGSREKNIKDCEKRRGTRSPLS